MDIHTLLIVAGIVFGFVSLMHLLRVVFGVSIIIGGKKIPMWASFLGFIIALSLSIWTFSAVMH